MLIIISTTAVSGTSKDRLLTATASQNEKAKSSANRARPCRHENTVKQSGPKLHANKRSKFFKRSQPISFLFSFDCLTTFARAYTIFHRFAAFLDFCFSVVVRFETHTLARFDFLRARAKWLRNSKVLRVNYAKLLFIRPIRTSYATTH